MTLLLIILTLGGLVLGLVAVPCDVIAEGRAQLRCAGCTKGRIVPGCEVHDPQQRKAEA